RPHRAYMRPSYRPAGHRPHGPSMNPMRPNINGARPNRSFFIQAHSYETRHFLKSSAVKTQYRALWVPTVNRNNPPVNRKFSTGRRNFPTFNRKFPTASRKFTTGSIKIHTADMGRKEKAVKPSACWVWNPSQNLSNKGPINNSVSDSGCSRHMTGNISYLSGFESFDGGYVSFGQGGCKITGKGTIKTDSECIVLGRNFKLLDDANILLRTPRRLGQLNVKTMNKLVRHNLVRGLPTKIFDNDHTCSAFLKGKQHKASCKSKSKDETCDILKKFITEIQNLKDLKVKIIRCDNRGEFKNKEMNDFCSQKGIKREFSNARTPQQNGVAERRNRTLIEAAPTSTKDETSDILKKFITEIENLKDLKVKIIRCDNGGEFRNKEMNDFCSQKGIKREFSNARTLQQNGVAERRNRTLIEAARTMLADAKLPVTFWAEAVNTACYVQNRVLLNKSQNKTLYELFNGRTPAIGFLKPFGCHVMILNTLDNLGKFEAKGDEGYFIGYLMSSKAFRVFNKRTRRVEENLHVEFLENKAIEKGAGPLTKSMNYVPVDAGTNSPNFSGTKDATNQEVKKDVSSLRYIALPNWAHDALLESSSSKPYDESSTKVPEGSGNLNPTTSSSNPPADQMETLTVESPIPTVSSPVPTACLNDSPEPSSEARLISKRVTNQEETPSLDNILSLINRFDDILGVTTSSDEAIGVEADVSNMETTISASPTPTLRIHKDHPKSQIIGHVDTPIKTRHKSKEVKEQSFIATIYQKTDPALLQFCLFSCFLSQVEPKKVSDALQDPSWSAFLYGTIDDEVYLMQPPGFQDPTFPTKVYKVEKAMYGLHQAPRAWYGTLSKYLLMNGFQRGTIDQTLFIRRQKEDFILVQVYVDDIIFSSSNPQLYREFKALMHKKFQMSAMGESLGKDGPGKDVDLHLYRSMIGSLMYLTASRPDIMFAWDQSKTDHEHSKNTPILRELLENKAIDKSAGSNWLFDINSLTKSMNYVSVDAGRFQYLVVSIGMYKLAAISYFSTALFPLPVQTFPTAGKTFHKGEFNTDFHPMVDFIAASPL
nr:hypothetical protein [Tanacetum cinerariifolium]